MSILLSIVTSGLLAFTQQSPAPEANSAPASLQGWESLCAQGDHGACVEVGWHLIQGDGPEQAQRATALFDATCTAGHVGGCAELGMSLMTGRGTPPDIARSETLLNEACSLNDALACLYAALGHHEAVFAAPSQSSAVRFYQQSCSLGEGTACYNLALSYSGEIDGPTSPDPQLATHFYRQGCDHGPLYICTSLARHLYALDPESHAAESNSLYRAACELGEADACAELGYSYLNGIGVNSDDRQAEALFTRSCDMGSALGCTNLGWMHGSGRAAQADLETAEQLFRDGCAAENPDACELLEHLSNNRESWPWGPLAE